MSVKGRAPNFTSNEIERLIELMEINRDLISGKLGGLYKTQSDVKEAWREIAHFLNSSTGNGYKRTERDIKKKWKDLKFTAKKKAAQIKLIGNTNEGGSGNVVLTPFEKKILKIIDSTSKEGTDGSDNETSNLRKDETDENDLSLTNESTENDDKFEASPLQVKVLVRDAQPLFVKSEPGNRFTKGGPHAQFSSINRDWTYSSKSTPRVHLHRLKKRKIDLERHEDVVNSLVSVNKSILEELKKSNKLKSETLKQMKISNRLKLFKLQKKYNISEDDLNLSE